jgi:nucleoside-diphosphate-sugar epimerase
MKKKNIIFITGGSGRIGKKLTDYLVRNKYKCYVNSRKKIKYKKPSDTILYKKDILDKKFIIPEDVNVVCHAASLTDNNKETYLVNNQINKKIFEIIKKHKNIKKLIFFSSVAVYSDKNRGKVNEKIYLNENNNYSKSKLFAEKLFLNLKIKVCIIRIPGIIGTGIENNFFSSLVSKLKENRTVIIYNKENLFNNILLIDKLNSFIEQLVKKNFKSGIILLGSSKPLKLANIVNYCRKKIKSKSEIIWKKSKKGIYLDISKAIITYKFNAYSTIYSIRKYLNKYDRN